MADQRDVKRSNRRIHRSLDGDQKIIEQTLEISARSARLLEVTAPDTFLGRKRREHLPPADGATSPPADRSKI